MWILLTADSLPQKPAASRSTSLLAGVNPRILESINSSFQPLIKPSLMPFHDTSVDKQESVEPFILCLKTWAIMLWFENDNPIVGVFSAGSYRNFIHLICKSPLFNPLSLFNSLVAMQQPLKREKSRPPYGAKSKPQNLHQHCCPHCQQIFQSVHEVTRAHFA